VFKGHSMALAGVLVVKPVREARMISGRSLGRGVPVCLAYGALALSLAGCGGRVSVCNDAEDIATRELLAKLKTPRTTLTRKQLGEAYPERAWSTVRRGFKPVYGKVTEADAFEWEYLTEVEEKRRVLIARREKIRTAERLQAHKAAERERKRKAEAAAASPPAE